jgi:hypothetical protein
MPLRLAGRGTPEKPARFRLLRPQGFGEAEVFSVTPMLALYAVFILGRMCHCGMMGSGVEFAALASFAAELAWDWAVFCPAASFAEPLEFPPWLWASLMSLPALSLSADWLATASLTAKSAIAAVLCGAGWIASGAVAEVDTVFIVRPRSALETWTPICADFVTSVSGGPDELAGAGGDTPVSASGAG